MNNEFTSVDIKELSELFLTFFFQTVRSSRFYESNVIKQYNQYNNSFNRD